MALKYPALATAAALALLAQGVGHAAWAAPAFPQHAAAHASGARFGAAQARASAAHAGEDASDQTDGSDQDDPNAVPAIGIRPKGYTVTTGSIKALMSWKPPRIPDVSGYTEAAAMRRLQRRPAGHVYVGGVLDKLSFKTFMGTDKRMRVWARRQLSLPKAIFVAGGYVTPEQIARALPRRYFAQTGPGVFVARLPIDVLPGATLYIGKKVKDLRLSLDRGAFLINEGILFIHDSRLEGWNEAAGKPSWFRNKHDFRPFILSWGGSHTYIIHSTVAHLGYAASKSYGISISQFSPSVEPLLKRKRPDGWLLDSQFFDNWYGFYCYEATGVVIRGNTYHDNIKYGIDPHDRSRKLIIAQNTVYGTKIKHGIIVSREVDDSWIIKNKSFNNKLSGIVIDRSSKNDVIAMNESYRNHSDGITIYESPHTTMWRNVVVGNERHGIRVRNSIDVQLRDNVIIGNGLSGIYGDIENLNGTGRNLKLDPFHPVISMTVVGGQLVSNGSSPITIDQPLSLEIYHVGMRKPGRRLGIKFSGVLGRHQKKVLDILVRRKLPMVIKPLADSVDTASK